MCVLVWRGAFSVSPSPVKEQTMYTWGVHRAPSPVKEQVVGIGPALGRHRPPDIDRPQRVDRRTPGPGHPAWPHKEKTRDLL